MLTDKHKLYYTLQKKQETIFNNIIEIEAPSLWSAVSFGLKGKVKEGKVIELIKVEKVV